ncbi:MAG: pyrroline-5-carboxylate reductase [Armatimonadota bacterium]|nr:pyrroline-5-carboxylate reductase [Armatimonadota bacterium]MDR7562124.1 pyrroline-5-carboxylate reductase [Armatimonadota bacterium]MDR7568086.1 pyrroline-5-carboxylate reductase [Armatimonadota bacterium]MDR7602292.1 pyrroline-5-carboxylate reductase [Armatimonadota bacterium]
MLERHTFGFVGAGNMAEALLVGLLSAERVPPERIWMVNRSNRERLHALAARYGVRTAQTHAELCARADVLVLAVKPKDAPEALEELADHVSARHVLISVVTGLTLQTLEHAFPGVPVVRTMPNTPTAIREGVTAFTLGRCAGEAEARLTRELFGAVGKVVEVPEGLLDAVTGLSGSGPAYVFFLVESLIEGGIRAGLDPQIARDLVVQTVFGAACMLRETGEDPGELRRRVTSPGGTTMAGVGVLEERDVRGAVVEAVQRAARRARELRR